MLASPVCKKSFVFLTCLGLIAAQTPLYAASPQSHTASGPAPSASQVIDIALGTDGVLNGRAVDGNGNQLAAAPVEIHYGDQAVAHAVTDEDGKFSVSQLRGGLHRVVVQNHQAKLRLWTAGAAPPSAHQDVLIVAGDGIVRGELPAAGVGLAALGTGLAIAALIVALDTKSELDDLKAQNKAMDAQVQALWSAS